MELHDHKHNNLDSVPLVGGKKLPERRYSEIKPGDGEKLWYRTDIMEDVSQGVIRKLVIVSIVCTTFIIVEIVGGVLANSLAI